MASNKLTNSKYYCLVLILHIKVDKIDILNLIKYYNDVMAIVYIIGIDGIYKYY